MMILRTTLCAFLIAFLAGCAAQPETHYYDLVSQSEASDARLAESVTLGIGPISLPQMLDRPNIVVRKGGTNVEVANFHIWAGELEPVVTRVLTENISLQLKHDAVWPSPWDNRFRPEYQVRIFVDRFSGELKGPVMLSLSWTLLADYGQRVVTTQRYRSERQSDGSYQAYVQALNGLLEGFSGELASELAQRIPQK